MFMYLNSFKLFDLVCAIVFHALRSYFQLTDSFELVDEPGSLGLDGLIEKSKAILIE